MTSIFKNRVELLQKEQETLINRKNHIAAEGNGVFNRYQYPVLTANHVPLTWKYDFDPETNPYFMERIGINAVFNAGAIKFNGKYILVTRVEGSDRKSFFAIAESENGVDGFRFWDHPLVFDTQEGADTNVYDMRLVQHEDGWIYGLFCTEQRDPSAPEADQTSALAQCGIIRTKDLKNGNDYQT